MELYLFLALLLIYILTAFMVKKVILHKIWTLAFILAFVVTAVSIAFIRVSGQDVMMSANELNWYYLLYLFGSLSVVYGISQNHAEGRREYQNKAADVPVLRQKKCSLPSAAG